MVLDTLKTSKKLRGSGMTESEAGTVSEVLKEFGEQLVTKEDLESRWGALVTMLGGMEERNKEAVAAMEDRNKAALAALQASLAAMEGRNQAALAAMAERIEAAQERNQAAHAAMEERNQAAVAAVQASLAAMGERNQAAPVAMEERNQAGHAKLETEIHKVARVSMLQYAALMGAYSTIVAFIVVFVS